MSEVASKYGRSRTYLTTGLNIHLDKRIFGDLWLQLQDIFQPRQTSWLDAYCNSITEELRADQNR